MTKTEKDYSNEFVDDSLELTSSHLAAAKKELGIWEELCSISERIHTKWEGRKKESLDFSSLLRATTSLRSLQEAQNKVASLQSQILTLQTTHDKLKSMAEQLGAGPLAGFDLSSLVAPPNDSDDNLN